MDHYELIAENAIVFLGINPEAPVYRMDRLARIGAHRMAGFKRKASKATRRAYRGARVRSNPAGAWKVF